MERAKRIFHKYRMHRREHRNAVLIYLSLADRSFAVLGDEGIHKEVGGHFWKEISQSMQDYFCRGEFLKGIEHAVREIGGEFKKHFTYKTW